MFRTFYGMTMRKIGMTGFVRDGFVGTTQSPTKLLRTEHVVDILTSPKRLHAFCDWSHHISGVPRPFGPEIPKESQKGLPGPPGPECQKSAEKVPEH